MDHLVEESIYNQSADVLPNSSVKKVDNKSSLSKKDALRIGYANQGS